MRLLLPLAALLALTPFASAQNEVYSVYATQAELDDGGTLSGALPTCLAVVNNSFGDVLDAAVYFVDRASGALASYDRRLGLGARTAVVAPAEALAAAAGAPVAGCVDAEAVREYRPDGTVRRVVFVALATAAGPVAVLRVEPEAGAVVRLTDPLSPADDGRGITGIAFGQRQAVSGMPSVGLVFLARSRAAGAPESGMYTLAPETAGQTPAPLALDAGADPVGITTDFLNGATLVSSSAGSGLLQNALLTESDSSFTVSDGFCEGGSCGSALGDIVTDYLPDSDIRVPYVLVYERGADDRVLARRIFGFDAPVVVFQASGLVAATGIAGFAPAGRSGYLSVLTRSVYTEPSTLLLAGSDEGGATPGIYGAAALVPVGSEPAAVAVRSLSVSPNPASGHVAVRVSLAAPAASATVAVVDALGRRVAVLHDGPLGAGERTFTAETGAWPAGVYVVRVSGVGVAASARLVVAR